LLKHMCLCHQAV